MTKVLFLDIDGVLNAAPDYLVRMPENDILRINMGLVGRLKDIVKSTGCDVVLSSSWRLMGGGREFAEKSCGFKFLDETCDDSDLCRGGQIQVWLDNNKQYTKYAIVDDDGDMLDHQLKHFFQTEFEHGLTETIAYRIKYHLNKDS